MNCPVCKRDLAPTLSICPSCGTMMNDSVREELETKVVSASNSGRLKSINIVATPPPAPPVITVAVQPQLEHPGNTVSVQPQPVSTVPVQTRPAAAMAVQPPKPVRAKVQTSELLTKKTSPTLVGFQPKAAAVPAWRLQLQNSVRQRNATSKHGEGVDAVSTGYKKQLVTNGANALKADFVEEENPALHSNPKVAKALERIQESRKAFRSPEAKTAAATSPVAARNYPFNVVSRPTDAVSNEPKPVLNAPPKPRLVSSLRIEKKKFDTNKLPPLPEPAKLSSSLDGSAGSAKTEPAGAPLDERDKPIKAIEQELVFDAVEPEIEEAENIEELDDLAPMPHRFNAALFDLIIGGFAGLIVLSPFMMSGGNWLTVSGVLAILAATAIATFVYLTVAIGLNGRTVGMRLFSLELIDAEQNEYPSLHQAAVHSSVFILSLAFAGLGFLPIFFNEERRAAHDLLSGTILVREF